MPWRMRRRPERASRVAAALVLLAVGAACHPDKDLRQPSARRELAERAARLETALEQAAADSAAVPAARPVARWVMPKSLSEVSGLALTGDGRLFGHDDERGIIHEVDYRRGVVRKHFQLGSQLVRADFEGLAIVEGRFLLVTSTGKIYETREGQRNEKVRYTVYDTRLGKECEFEGLTYDPAIRRLLLACKVAREQDVKGQVVIYRVPLPGQPGTPSRLRIPLASLVAGTGRESFHPSGIERDPRTGNYVVIAAEERQMAEVTPEGRVLWTRPLAKELHGQPEGVTITPDGLLVIGDEARQREGTITLYTFRP